MRTVIVWAGVLLVLVGGAYGGYRWLQRASGSNAASYRTAAVKRTDLISTISATGTLVPEDVVDIGAQVNGLIASFGVDTDGKSIDYRSTVKEGQVLARIDDAIYAADVATGEAQLEQARAQVRVAEASRDQAKAKLEQAQRDWARAEKLGKSQALSQADYDAAKSNFDQAEASLTLAEASIGQQKAQVSIAEASLLRSRRNLAYCTISSPVDGVVIDRKVDVGQTVVASLNAPSLFLLAKDLRRMQVLVQVNEADIGHVQPGEPVRFSVDAFPGRTFKGEVRKVRLNATMTQNVVTYTVEIVTDNSDLTLLPYLTANVRFELARREGVLAVPGAALRWSPSGVAGEAAGGAPQGSGGPSQAGNGGGAAKGGARDASPAGEKGAARPARKSGTASSVWVLQPDGQLREVSVRSGLSDGTLTEIEGEGINEGDLVVIGEVAPSAGASPGAQAGGSPFAPQPFRGGGGGRGR